MIAEPPILEARNITKIYPNGVRANRSVTLTVVQGEIHALVFRWRLWHRIATEFTLGVLGMMPMSRRIERAFASEI